MHKQKHQTNSHMHLYRAFLLAFSVSALFGLGQAAVSALTFEDTVDVEFTFEPTVQVDVSGNLTIPSLSAGDAADSNIITVTAGTNSAQGYGLYASVGSASTNYTDLRTTSANTSHVFSSITSNVSALASLSDNTWGYSYCTTSCDTTTNWVSGSVGSTATGYNGLPLYNSANSKSGVTIASSTAPASSIVSFKIGARAGNSQPAGTYTNTVNFTGVANVLTTTYNVTFNANAGSDTVTGMPGGITGATTTNALFTLNSSVPVRDKYAFMGWCTAEPTGSTCSGTTYLPGRVVHLANPGGTNDLTLYAVWQFQGHFMQDLDPSLCTATPITALDSRDGKAYTIARLSDGNCWMTQNLDLDIDPTKTYTSADTDISADWTPNTATYATGTTTWNGSLTAPESYDPGDLCWNGTIISIGGTVDTNAGACGDDKHYHIGNYYNWTAAVAMNDSSSYTDMQDVNQSICPAGWRLPTYSGSKSYDTLVSILSLTSGTSGNIQNSPVYFVYGGYWVGSSYYVGSRGGYWSSVVVGGGGALSLYFTADDYLFPQNIAPGYDGYSVRCVLDEQPPAMQDVATWGSTLNTGDEVTAIDTRDGKEYTVAKLADGNIWMTQNLDLDIDSTKTYTPADTDISANWTPNTATYATDTTTWNYSTTAPESYDPGDLVPEGDLCWIGTLDASFSGTLDTYTGECSDDKHYHIGNYYNWTAAVAMNDSSSYTTNNQDVNQSICPAGWRLPIGGTTNTGSKSFQYLADQLSLTAGTSGNIQNSPVYFVYGGYWDGSSGSVGGLGYYWSSVVYSDTNAYDLYFNAAAGLNPQGRVSRGGGRSVRCVAR